MHAIEAVGKAGHFGIAEGAAPDKIRINPSTLNPLKICILA
jgi:hypothetical protein